RSLLEYPGAEPARTHLDPASPLLGPRSSRAPHRPRVLHLPAVARLVDQRLRAGLRPWELHLALHEPGRAAHPRDDRPHLRHHEPPDAGARIYRRVRDGARGRRAPAVDALLRPPHLLAFRARARVRMGDDPAAGG